MSTELHYLELTELTRRIHAKEISPVDATKAQLDRIASLDGRIGSYVLVTADVALEQARQAEAEIARGDVKGPLHGAPIAVKDLCWTKGIPTAGGMAIYKDFRPSEDATVVRKLRDAGAVLLGKLKTTESAYADHHPSIPAPLNPWNADHWVGASSSGSGAGTASGFCYGSLGSDTGGSIRFPSAANGVTGLKPTWGRVSRYGVFELAATLDHIGPMTRSAADCAAMLGAIAGIDPNDPTASPEPVPNYLAGIRRGLRGLRIGVDADWNTTKADPDVVRITSEALKSIAELGGEIREVKFPDSTAIVTEWVPHCAVETAVAHEATYPARKSEYGSALAALLDIGRGLSGMDYQKIILHRNDFRGRVQALFEAIDLLVVPAQPFASPTLSFMTRMIQEPELLPALLRYTAPFDATGNPTITLPGGFTDGGMPLAFQFVAGHFAEDLLCRAGFAYQQATDWHRRHPALS
jgi:amidase